MPKAFNRYNPENYVWGKSKRNIYMKQYRLSKKLGDLDYLLSEDFNNIKELVKERHSNICQVCCCLELPCKVLRLDERKDKKGNNCTLICTECENGLEKLSFEELCVTKEKDALEYKEYLGFIMSNGGTIQDFKNIYA